MKMNVERLQHLQAILQSIKVPKSGLGFNLRDWHRVRPDCGTTACACGWAGLDPVFNEQGFSLTDKLSGSDGLIPMFTDNGYTVHGWTAVELFFGLTYGESDYLFSANSYEKIASPKDVANRIGEFIESKKEA